jgi:imidazoleglycerol-phosphate dehydratase
MSKLKRETKETQIVADVRIGSGAATVTTDEQFLTHMVVTLAKYSGVDITLEATGDLRHHLIEDVGILLGLALKEEVPGEATRYGWAQVPMDEALVEAAIDVGGRPFYEGGVPSSLYEHFLQSFATNLGATLHVRVLRGTDKHHVVEAAIKATGLALRQALRKGDAVFSTKGSVAIERLDAEPLDESLGDEDGGGS